MASETLETFCRASVTEAEHAAQVIPKTSNVAWEVICGRMGQINLCMGTGQKKGIDVDSEEKVGSITK